MKRSFDIDKIRRAGFVVKHNLKKEIDTVSKRDGSKFKLWVGDDNKVAISGVTHVKLDTYHTMAVHMRGDEFGGTVFGFNKVDIFANNFNNLHLHVEELE